jgi:type IV pilus assembly protein PilY1
MYTYTAATAPSNVDLTLADHLFNETNALVTKSMLGNGGMTDAYRTSLMQWARGVDLFDVDEDGDTTDARRRMGDPLHSNPVVVNYGGTDANPDITLFIATNEGLLHAIDTTDGSEVFSFIPQELLPNLDILYNNSGANAHPYGLDGPLTAWAKDVNNNGVLQDSGGNTETGEHAYLYVGMRRGGNNYYALNVTDRSAPELKWMIQGGTGNFGQLAQTWSKMELASIKSSGSKRTVLIFGGGYDPLEDRADNVEYVMPD